jgi:hypothetical protein
MGASPTNKQLVIAPKYPEKEKEKKKRTKIKIKVKNKGKPKRNLKSSIFLNKEKILYKNAEK